MMVFFPQRSLLSGLLLATLCLGGCANSPLGETLQRSLAADPQLQQNPPFGVPANSASPATTTQATLPADFPGEIARYPNATLQQVEPTNQGSVTRWSSTDGGDRVLSFYRNQFQTGDWQVTEQPSDDVQGTFAAQKGDLQVTITVQPAASGETASPASQFEIRYNRGTIATASPSPTASPEAAAQPGDPDFIGPIPQANGASPAPSATASPIAGAQTFSDLDKVPKQLRQYVEDLAQLGVLSLSPSSTKGNSGSANLFQPDQTLTRREFARWLVAANNRLYANRPTQQVRLAVPTDQPAFQDVPRTDPDFAAIQGLAAAGLIPSPLSGDSTTVTFRPDAPLTRETLVLWKVPLDTRQGLPTANLDAIKQTWGFQDVARIDPRAQRAVLADFQNGDLANIRRAFGYTTLFQPKRAVTRAEAAAALWYFGSQGEGQSAQDALKAETVKPSPQT